MANGPLHDAIAPIPAGRGGANIAHDDNLLIINDNPAGLAWIDEDTLLELGGEGVYRSVHYADPQGGDTFSNWGGAFPYAAAAWKLPWMSATVGLGAYFPGSYRYSYKMENLDGIRRRYDSDASLFKLMPSIGFKVTDYISIGGGVGMSYGETHLNQQHTFQTGKLAGEHGQILMDTYGYGVTGNVGIQIRPLTGLTLGGAFITQTAAAQDGDFDVDFTGSPAMGKLGLSDPWASYDANYASTWPASAGGGLSYTFWHDRVSAEYWWYDWSHAHNHFRYRFIHGSNAVLNTKVGASFTEVVQAQWQDGQQVKFGYEHNFWDCFTGRFGYIYNNDPVPDRMMTPLLPATPEHTLTIGVGRKFGNVGLDAAYQYGFLTKRHVGDSELKGDDFAHSTLRTRAHWVMAGLSIDF